MLELFKKQPFFYLYLIFITPSYLLPIMGSNSFFANLYSTRANTAFYIHLITLILAALITLIQGMRIKKPWIVSFSLLALIFDLVPILNLLPFIATLFHIITLYAATQTRVNFQLPPQA